MANKTSTLRLREKLKVDLKEVVFSHALDSINLLDWNAVIESRLLEPRPLFLPKH